MSVSSTSTCPILWTDPFRAGVPFSALMTLPPTITFTCRWTYKPHLSLGHVHDCGFLSVPPPLLSPRPCMGNDGVSGGQLLLHHCEDRPQCCLPCITFHTYRSHQGEGCRFWAREHNSGLYPEATAIVKSGCMYELLSGKVGEKAADLDHCASHRLQGHCEGIAQVSLLSGFQAQHHNLHDPLHPLQLETACWS